MKLRDLALRIAAGLAAGIAVGFLVLPVLALMLRSDPARLLGRLDDAQVLDALRLSVVTSMIALVVVVALGIPTALLLATRTFRGQRLLETLVLLPMVLPPTVAGLGLLLAFGRAGLLGGAFGAFGISVPFTTIAVVFAQVFVGLPFFISAAAAGFRAVDPRYLDAAATLRSSEAYTVTRVMLPLALPSVLAGAAMGWARALGEFGATITFAGNLPGRTQTMPLAVYLSLESDLDSAIALAVLLLAVSFGVLFAVRARPFTPARQGDAARTVR